jgi:hypothetical protein
MDGSLAFKGDYVADGTSVGAGLGDFICGVRIAADAQKVEKGAYAKATDPSPLGKFPRFSVASLISASLTFMRPNHDLPPVLPEICGCEFCGCCVL